MDSSTVMMADSSSPPWEDDEPSPPEENVGEVAGLAASSLTRQLRRLALPLVFFRVSRAVSVGIVWA